MRKVLSSVHSLQEFPAFRRNRKNNIIEIAFDAYENKQYRDPYILYPYLKEQIKDDGMYYVLLEKFEAILHSLT